MVWESSQRKPALDSHILYVIEHARFTSVRARKTHAAKLTAELVKTLGSDVVDVVILNHATPFLYHRVLRDGVRLLTRDPAATTTREGRALSRYCDYVPHLREIEAIHAARIARGHFGR